MYNDKIYITCVTEMFKRVGLEFPNNELTEQHEWFNKYTWTEENENDFKKWMIKYLMKKKKLNKKYAERGVDWFLLDIGWKVSGLNKTTKIVK